MTESKPKRMEDSVTDLPASVSPLDLEEMDYGQMMEELELTDP